MVMLFVACKPGTPSQYLQPGEMEDILVEYYMAQAMAQQVSPLEGGRDYNTAMFIEAVLKKHGVTKADFDSSLVYYYTRSDRFEPICKRVSERLDELALTQGASEGEIGKYAQYNATGDTANVWADRNIALLMPMPPYNRWDFVIEADSTYRRGDALMMQFMSDFMYQTGSKNGIVYMAVEYDDTIVSRNLRFSVSGLAQLRVPEDTTRRMKAVKGFFYLDGGNESSTSTRLLFLNNVQLIRFHTIDADQELPTDSIPQGGDAGQIAPDSVSRGDSIRGGDEVLPLDSGTAVHRMASRADSAHTR
jgi:hypothetical protein